MKKDNQHLTLKYTPKLPLKVAFMVGIVTLALVGCSQKSPNVASQPTNIVQTNSTPNRYQVKSGDTVSKIARAYGLDWRQLSVLNDLDSNHTIYVGQWLTLWEDIEKSSPKRLTFAKNTPPTTKTVATTVSLPTFDNQSTPLVGSSALMQFDYPVGKNNSVARQFATPTNHGLTEGMFFSGRAGDLVKASLGGQVVHTDTNTARPMVAIQHTDGYVSSYFDLQNIQVRQGQSVSKGETLGVMNAQTPSGVALFEFRIAKDGKVIDPVSVMR